MSLKRPRQHAPVHARLVDTGLRLSEMRDEQGLLALLIDEAAKLSGAERVLLLLEAPEGMTLAGSLVPAGEDTAALLRAVTPWLEETRRTRAVRLRHGPDGAAGSDQRSCLIAPLIAQRVLLGYLYADIEGALGRFEAAQRDLLATLASQGATALASVRFGAGLARQVEEHAAQLAVVNSVQRALAAELSLQGIYEAVGDSIRRVFDDADIGIRLFDTAAGLVHYPYAYENGERLHLAASPLRDKGISAHVMGSGQTLVINEDLAATTARYGSHVVPGTRIEKSAVFVPLFSGDRVRGLVQMLHMEREHAFGEADVRLLQTLVGALSVALENARLFDETQRLLKETEQRNAELAVINSIQQGMAAELSFQAIVDLVGDKLRDVFSTGDIGIRWRDQETGWIRYLYEYEHGVRIWPEAHPLNPASPIFQAVDARRVLVVGTRAEGEALGMRTLPGTDSSLSSVWVPIIGGDRVLGGMGLENYEREHAFSEADVRLLSTVAASMGVALENARLFAETQRLLKETEQRNAELAVINSIQQGVGAELNFQAIVDLVGDKLREVFATGNLIIAWRDEAAGLRRILYAYEHGARQDLGAVVDTLARPIDQALLLRKPVIIRNPAEAAALELRHFEGTDMSLSSVFVPMFSGDRFLGTIVLENYEREDAFGEADVRLLSTVAASMGVALENARLFAETQRLDRKSVV